MAEQRVNRAAKNRAAPAMSSEQVPATKKRAVLGELPNQSNIIRVNEPQQKASRAKAKVKRASTAVSLSQAVPEKREEEGKKRDPGIDIDGKSGDPQMCEAYAADIYEYLRKMEVSVT